MKNVKKRGVSPVIAAILLIGITIVAGVAVISTVLLVINAEEPISIIISKPESYSSTENDRAFYDSLVDSIILPITNDIREPLVIDTTQVLMYNAANNSIMDRWYVSEDNNLITFQGQESLFLNLKTEGKFDIQELSPGDKFYVTVPVRSEKSDFIVFTSPTFTVASSDTTPLYALEPINSAYQQGTEVFFDASLDQENESRLLNFAIFNYGNADKEKAFSVTIQLENGTLFSSDKSYLTLTVPNQGPTNNDTLCEFGEACVVASFNITKWANNRTKDSFFAYVSTGIETVKFSLTFVSETTDYFLTMPNMPRNNQQGEVIKFFSAKWWDDYTLDLTIIAWFNDTTNALPATLELMNLNSTVFRLESSSSVSGSISGTETLSTIPDENLPCGRGQTKYKSCQEFTWTITRKQITDGRFGPPFYTVMQPYYEFQVRWVEIPIVKTFRMAVNPPFTFPI